MRVSFQLLSFEVEKLYSKEFPPNSDKEIQEHCGFIGEFIRACGWEENEYLERWMSEQESLLS